MPMIDYANQIANLLRENIPYSGIDIGFKFQASAISFDDSKVYLEFEPEDYIYLSSIINDTINPNSEFTISGFYLKNRIKTFSSYPKNSLIQYGFEVEFQKPHKLTKDNIVALKGFTDGQYNISYKVLRTIDDFSAILYPQESCSIVDVTSNTGYTPIQYTTGFNGIKSLSDEGDNTLSFEVDVNDYFVDFDINNIDSSHDIFVYNFNENIKVIDKDVFISKLTNEANNSYLIVDTSSLQGVQKRSNANNQDSSYASYGRAGFFERNYTINLVYFLERNTDDLNNQTSSGSDIVDKQVAMFDNLTSILRQSLDNEESKNFSSLTILNDSVSSSVAEGRKEITYVIGFSVFYNSDLLLKIDDKNTYKINQVKVNNDVVDFS